MAQTSIWGTGEGQGSVLCGQFGRPRKYRLWGIVLSAGIFLTVSLDYVTYGLYATGFSYLAFMLAILFRITTRERN